LVQQEIPDDPAEPQTRSIHAAASISSHGALRQLHIQGFCSGEKLVDDWVKYPNGCQWQQA
jgi:hypothetical protein